MENKPKISIVVPVYNAYNFIEESLLSIIDQDYLNKELIVIDGGSSDGSLDIINKYKDDINIIVSETDKGLSHAVNKGLMAATGEYVCWLNADDYFKGAALSNVANYLAEHRNVDLLYGNADQVDVDGKLLSSHGAIPFDMDKLLHNRCYIPCQATFFRRSALAYIGLFDSSLQWNMDWDMWKRFAVAGYKLSFLNKNIAAWRIHDTSISYSKNAKWQLRRLFETINSTRKYKKIMITPLELKLYPWVIIYGLGLYHPLRWVWHRCKIKR
jgi:glycosyltransferase involved in cell wall biosynthesis